MAIQLSGDDINLAYEDEMGLDCFAYSTHIDGLQDEKEVAERAYGLEVILNGALRLDREEAQSERVRFTEVVRLETGLLKRINPEALEQYPFDKDAPVEQKILDISNPKTDYSSYLIHLSKSDDNIRTLVLLVGLLSSHSALEKVLTWGTLYKIYDSVRFVSRESGIDYLPFVDEIRLDQFTGTCNNMSVLGISSRHGLAKNSPPKKTLTDLAEAVDLIVKMASKFVRAYVTSKYS